MAESIKYMTSPTGSSLARERAANDHSSAWKLPYFGTGNELWGCGGNMTSEFVADETRRYAAFVKATSGTRIMKFATGANSDDYHWTEVRMRDAPS